MVQVTSTKTSMKENVHIWPKHFFIWLKCISFTLRWTSIPIHWDGNERQASKHCPEPIWTQKWNKRWLKLILPSWPSVVKMAPLVSTKPSLYTFILPSASGHSPAGAEELWMSVAVQGGGRDGKSCSILSCLIGTTTAPQSLVAGDRLPPTKEMLCFFPPFNICQKSCLGDGILSLEKKREGWKGWVIEKPDLL